MIAVDTSALMAIAMKETAAERCLAALLRDDVAISAGTVAEALIVSERRGISHRMAALFAAFDFEVITVTPAAARRIGEAYRRWGKCVNPAALNFGDCFSYDVAKEFGCPLLFIGNDFAKTDIAAVL